MNSYSNNKVADEKGQWVLVAKQSGRESKAIMKKAAKKKMKDKNVGCARVQSHNGRVSEVSCENCTHTAIAAKENEIVQGLLHTERQWGSLDHTRNEWTGFASWILGF